MASPGPADADTFPKLLIRNARNFGNRPAMRHKDLGIWQTLTWAQLLDEVRAYAVGLHLLGLHRGEAHFGMCQHIGQLIRHRVGIDRHRHDAERLRRHH